MEKWVPVSDKKKFIRWFLNQYRLKKLEVKKLFDFLLAHEQLLERVHFTDKTNPNGRTFLISTICSETKPFEFHKRSKIINHVEESIQDLRSNSKERIYIVLHFRGKMFCHPYMNVRENIKQEMRIEQDPPMLFRILADIYLDQSLLMHRLAELEQAIDRCLESGDKVQFMQLSEEKKKIQQELDSLL